MLWSASYPCSIAAGTVPPGRLPLLRRVPKRCLPGSSSHSATWPLLMKSISTSRFLESSGPTLPCPRVDFRHGSVAASSGLQATPDSYCAAFAAFVRRISTPWLPSTYARLPHRTSEARPTVFPDFSASSLGRISILRFPGPDMSLYIAFFRFRRCSPAACSVCKLPLSLFRPRTVPPGCQPRLLLNFRRRQPAFPDFVSVPSCLPFPLAVPAAL